MFSGIILIIVSTVISLLSLWESELSKKRTLIPVAETDEQRQARLAEKLERARTIRVKVVTSLFVLITFFLMLWQLDEAENEKNMQHLRDAKRYSEDSLIHINERRVDSLRFLREESLFDTVKQRLVWKAKSDSIHYENQREISSKLIKTQEVLIDSMVDHFNQLNLPLSPMALWYKITFDGKELGDRLAVIRRRAQEIIDLDKAKGRQSEFMVIEEYDKSYTVWFDGPDVLDSVMTYHYLDMRVYRKLDYGEFILDFCMNKPGFRANFNNLDVKWRYSTANDQVFIDFHTSKEEYITTINGMHSIGQLPGSYLLMKLGSLQKFELSSLVIIAGDTRRVFCPLELEPFYDDPVVRECSGQWYRVKGVKD